LLYEHNPETPSGDFLRDHAERVEVVEKTFRLPAYTSSKLLEWERDSRESFEAYMLVAKKRGLVPESMVSDHDCEAVVVPLVNDDLNLLHSLQIQVVKPESCVPPKTTIALETLSTPVLSVASQTLAAALVLQSVSETLCSPATPSLKKKQKKKKKTQALEAASVSTEIAVIESTPPKTKEKPVALSKQPIPSQQSVITAPLPEGPPPRSNLSQFKATLSSTEKQTLLAIMKLHKFSVPLDLITRL